MSQNIVCPGCETNLTTPAEECTFQCWKCGETIELGVGEVEVLEPIQCPKCELSLNLQVDAPSVRCPGCGHKIVLDEEGDRLEQEEREDEEYRKERERRRNRRKKRKRYAGLNKVVAGLGFHYVGAILFLGALWGLWLGFGAVLAGMITGVPDVHVAGFAVTMLFLGVVLAALATVVEIPAAILCLAMPDGKSRGLLIGSMVARGLLLLTLVWFVLAESKSGPAFLLTLLMIAAWILWMSFLRQIGEYVDQRHLSASVARVMFHAVFAVLAILIFLFVLSLFVRLLIVARSPFLRFFIVVGLAGPLATFVTAWYKISQQDSILMVVLYPTGIPFLMNYLETVAGIRTVLMRRA